MLVGDISSFLPDSPQPGPQTEWWLFVLFAELWMIVSHDPIVVNINVPHDPRVVNMIVGL